MGGHVCAEQPYKEEHPVLPPAFTFGLSPLGQAFLTAEDPEVSTCYFVSLKSTLCIVRAVTICL